MSDGLTVPFALAAGLSGAVASSAIIVIAGALQKFVHSDDCREFSCRICYKKNCLVRLNDFEEKVDWTIDNISRDLKNRLKKV